MIGYNPSHLNTNETLLEAFHRVEAYLKANPQYQVYQSSATYQEGTQEYALDTIVVPEGSTVGKGDVVLFSNVYYAVITAVSETTFSVETATNFRGAQGEPGQKGDTGATGADGVTPNISVSATIDNNEGTPSVDVTKGGTDANPSFNLDFHNLKGETGATGATGADGNHITISEFNHKFISLEIIEVGGTYRDVNDWFFVLGTYTDDNKTYQQLAGCKVIEKGSASSKARVMSILDLPAGTTVYDNLSDIPVINQDLTASGFTPVANTYYRHTGATTDTFTQGVIYLYDTAYHKLGESGSGGTTLNQYTVTFENITGNSTLASHLNRIVKTAKGRVQITDPDIREYSAIWYSDSWLKINVTKQYSNNINFETMDLSSFDGSLASSYSLKITASDVTTGTVTSLPDILTVKYFNDTEIT